MGHNQYQARLLLGFEAGVLLRQAGFQATQGIGGMIKFERSSIFSIPVSRPSWWVSQSERIFLYQVMIQVKYQSKSYWH